MNPPNLEICIEGYNIEQTDFYINQLIEKNNGLAKFCEKNSEELKKYEEENAALRKNFIDLSEQINNALSSQTEKIISYVSQLDSRLQRIENALGITVSTEISSGQTNVLPAKESNPCEKNTFEAEMASLHRDLSELRELFNK